VGEGVLGKGIKGFSTLGKNDLVFLLGMFGFFQESIGVIHEALALDFILEANNKEFS
jgi:hypothetical protein